MALQLRRMLSSRLGIATASFVAGIALVGGGYAWGSIPAASGVIQGCYTNSSPHVLRVIDTAKTPKCPSGTTSLAWNQTGPQGPPGPAQNVVTHTSPAGQSVPSFFDSTANPDGTHTLLASVTLTVAGPGPHLVFVTASTSPVVNTPALPYSTPCGPRDPTTRPGTFYAERGDGLLLGTADRSYTDTVDGPGTYAYQVFWIPGNNCANPSSATGLVTTYTIGAVGVSAMQL